jgi:hypothetical protein
MELRKLGQLWEIQGVLRVPITEQPGYNRHLGGAENVYTFFVESETMPTEAEALEALTMVAEGNQTEPVRIISIVRDQTRWLAIEDEDSEHPILVANLAFSDGS